MYLLGIARAKSAQKPYWSSVMIFSLFGPNKKTIIFIRMSQGLLNDGIKCHSSTASDPCYVWRQLEELKQIQKLNKG